jgi:hypothetical protein
VTEPLRSANKRNLLAVFITLLILLEMVAYVTTTPRPQEQFFQIYVLGSNRLAADYYPNDNPNISPGEPVTWYLGVTNDMGNTQFAAIVIRLGNQTINPPNDTQGLPSPAPLVTEYGRFIQNNETWEFPFTWSISNMTVANGSTHILDLQIGNASYRLPSSMAQNGYNFRIIIELWTMQSDTGALQFGWNTAGVHRVAWLQIWFNSTSTTHGP